MNVYQKYSVIIFCKLSSCVLLTTVIWSDKTNGHLIILNDHIIAESIKKQKWCGHNIQAWHIFSYSLFTKILTFCVYVNKKSCAFERAWRWHLLNRLALWKVVLQLRWNLLDIDQVGSFTRWKLWTSKKNPSNLCCTPVSIFITRLTFRLLRTTVIVYLRFVTKHLNTSET